MKNNLHHTGAAVCLSVLLLLCCLTSARAAPEPPGTGGDTAYLQDVLLEGAAGREKVTLVTSRQAGVTVESPAPKTVTVTLQGLYVPIDLRKILGEGRLKNVIRAVPAQKSTTGKPVAVVTLELKQAVPYRVRQEGNNVVIDFDCRSIAGRSEPPPAPSIAAPVANPPAPPTVSGDTAATPAPTVSPKAPENGGAKPNGQDLMTINLQDSTIKEALELMSFRRPGLSIISTDDVDLKGKLTIHLKAVTWDKAFETILKLKGLGAQRDDKILIVSTLRKMNEDERDRLTAEQEKKQREDKQKEMLQKELIEKGGLRQISIEAKIVEASDGFSRKLGVQWGYASTQTVGSGNYPLGVIASTNKSGLVDSTTGSVTTLSSGLALTESALAVNYPSAVSPTLGIVLGSAYSVFSAELSALEQDSRAKVVSSPMVITLDGEKAMIEQGEEIPVVTPASANNTATTTYKKAVLKLEVTPKITPDGKISMVIEASNDRANKAEKDSTTGNMPIYTNKVNSRVVVADGDTLIMGGVFKTEDSKGMDGVPWLARIPYLGWLFKTEEVDQSLKEISIFVTPRIVKAGVQLKYGADTKNGALK